MFRLSKTLICITNKIKSLLDTVLELHLKLKIKDSKYLYATSLFQLGKVLTGDISRKNHFLPPILSLSYTTYILIG